MAGWNRFDINLKGVEGIQERTIGGGILTLLSCICVAFLLFSEASVWWTVDVVHRMHVDIEPQDSPINIEVDITFLHEACTEIALDVSDAKSNKDILLQQEMKKLQIVSEGNEGCQYVGRIEVKKVAGDLHFGHAGSLNIFSFFEFLNFNSSHVVNHLRFGPQIPDMQTPLIDVTKIITANVATYRYFVNIVPTTYRYLNGKSIRTFQYSVTEHQASGQSNGRLSIPGVMFSYEFSPIAVEYIETKPSLLHFLTSTSAIVGGVFAVARMLDSALYSVSKKMD